MPINTAFRVPAATLARPDNPTMIAASANLLSDGKDHIDFNLQHLTSTMRVYRDDFGRLLVRSNCFQVYFKSGLTLSIVDVAVPAAVAVCPAF
jgi:hypothetical protein